MSSLEVPARSRPKRLLLVEDEPLIAAGIAQVLEDNGYVAIHSAYTFVEATQAAETGSFDGAILDVMLSTRYVWPIAETLRAKGTPFVLLTGLGRESIEPEFQDVPVIFKPFGEAELMRVLKSLL